MTAASSSSRRRSPRPWATTRPTRWRTFDRDNRRKVVNVFIRGAGIFESMADMDAATVNPSTGMMRDEFLTNSTLGTIDPLHPNRAGYLSMAKTIDIRVLAPPSRGHRDDDD